MLVKVATTDHTSYEMSRGMRDFLLPSFTNIYKNGQNHYAQMW